MLPVEANSALIDSVKAVTAYFEAEYIWAPGALGTRWPYILFICMIWPSMLFSFMLFTASLVAVHSARTFKSNTCLHSSLLKSLMRELEPLPALLTRMLMGPKFFFVHSKAFRISSSFVMSALNGYNLPALAASFWDSSSTLSTLRAKPTT